MGRPRTALIYDDSLRADMTGGYCLQALQKLTQVSHFRPDELGQISDSFDLFLCIDDGLDYSVREARERLLSAGAGPSTLLGINAPALETSCGGGWHPRPTEHKTRRGDRAQPLSAGFGDPALHAFAEPSSPSCFVKITQDRRLRRTSSYGGQATSLSV